jgi:hypothetical protein
MWPGLQTITDYKGKTSQVEDTDALLSDKLNTFFPRFEDNTVPPTRPAPKDCGLLFSVADVSETFKRVNPRKAADPDGIPSRSSEHAKTNWLECLQTYSISLYPSLLAPLASRCPPLFLIPRKLR